MNTLTVGQWVKRTGSNREYSTGREGHIVEINEGATRYRVYWKFEASDKPMKKPLRTWVAATTVVPIPDR